MNVSFDPFRMVNSYGAFGSVTKTRHEVSEWGVWSMLRWACGMHIVMLLFLLYVIMLRHRITGILTVAYTRTHIIFVQQVILQGTSDPVYASPTAVWRDFDFACKPGNIDRPPCLISPYHIRMDWLMWFAAFQSYQVVWVNVGVKLVNCAWR